MKSIKIKNEIAIVGILTFLLIIPLIRNSYAVDTSKTFTRQEMQDMVVATSLSYYYNNLYSDYSQYLKDKGYGYSKTLVGGTYAWRSTAHAPEDVNRTNRYFIDCSSFAGWYLDKNYATKITNNTTLKTTTAHTIYAKWTASSITLPNPKKEGYYFAGWYNETTKVGQGGASYTPAKDIVLIPSFIELPKVSLELDIKDNSTINVKVTKTTGVLTGYEIYKYNNSSKDYDPVKDTTDLNTTITHDFKDNSKTKIYVKPYVKIEGEKIYGENSIEKEIEQEIEEPEDEKEEIILTKPTGLKASSLDYRSLYISWNKVNGATGYNIYKYNSTTKKYYYVKSTRSLSTTTSYGLKKGTSTYYKVKAYRIVNGKKIYSNYSASDYVKV